MLIASGKVLTSKIYILYNIRRDAGGGGGSGGHTAVPCCSHEMRGPHFQVMCHMHRCKGLGQHGPIPVLYMRIRI